MTELPFDPAPEGEGGSDQLTAPPVAETLIYRVNWLVNLRWLAIGIVTPAFGLLTQLLPARLPWERLFAVMAALALYNLLLGITLRSRRLDTHDRSEPKRLSSVLISYIVLAPVLLLKTALTATQWLSKLATRAHPEDERSAANLPRDPLSRLLVPRELWGMQRGNETREAAILASAQISVDLLAVATLIHYSGGIENPFVFYSIFHVIISSILLSKQATFLQASLALTLIGGVAFAELSGTLPHYSVGILRESSRFANPFFVATIMFVLASTLFLAAFLATSLCAHLRSYEREALVLANEVKGKAKSLEQAYDHLIETDVTKSLQLRKVSHELRSPLATIQMALTVVLDGMTGEISERVRDMISRARRRTIELIMVSQDLLTLTRAKEGRLAVEKSAVSLSDLTQAVVKENMEIAGQARVSLLLDVASGSGTILGDPAGLAQLIANLVTNAIRYTSSGGAVVVRLRQQADHLRLEVYDTGIGIPEYEKENVFKEFYRAENAREKTAEGTGLGLAIVKAVADGHNASVSLESTVGQGTHIVIDFPHSH